VIQLLGVLILKTAVDNFDVQEPVVEVSSDLSSCPKVLYVLSTLFHCGLYGGVYVIFVFNWYQVF